jgi:Tol biopolymer transport system component
VSTPSNHIEPYGAFGGGPYTTLSEDIVAALFLPLGAKSANTTNKTSPLGCLLKTFCHSFLKSYLDGDVSGPKILKQVVGVINTLESPIPPTSSTGGKIAFRSTRDVYSEIYIMNADGTEQRNLTNTSAIGSYNNDPSWSPDGRKIAFTSNRNGNSGIYVMNADGYGEPILLTDDGGSDPAWSPDGSQIAFRRSDGLYVMNADGTDQRILILDNLEEWGLVRGEFDWSPDGSKIAFITRSYDEEEIVSLN